MIEKIYRSYGFDAMRRKWIEELYELIEVLDSYGDKQDDKYDLIDEVADVSFIIEQIIETQDIEEVVEQRIEFKKKRTHKRLF